MIVLYPEHIFSDSMQYTIAVQNVDGLLIYFLMTHTFEIMFG